MARTAPRRTRSGARSNTRPAGRGAPSIPDIVSVGRWLVRPEVLGTLLVILAVAMLPYLFPLTSIFGEARDGLVSLLGLHVFSLVVLLATVGVLLVARRIAFLVERRRHLAGLLAGLVFIAGILGRWHPEVSVGAVELAVHSAGGEAGRWLAGGLLRGLFWLLTFPLAFALLWPRTAAAIARATPGAAWRGIVMLWALGLHTAAWNGARRLVRGVANLHRGSDPADPYSAAYGGAPLALREDGDIAALAGPPMRGRQALEGDEGPSDEAEEPAPKRPRKMKQISMDLDTPAGQWRHSPDGWQLPPVALLAETKVETKSVLDNQRRAQLIVDTLASFGVDAQVVQINEGPTVTQFGVEPGWDVKTKLIPERDAAGNPILDETGQPKTKEVEVSRTRIRVNRITALQNDLALALAAPTLRIEAPVPGKAMVGIEVPNATTSIVSMRSVMESPAYQKVLGKAALPIALGQGVSGDPVVADLATMPHLLIAGATGAGKSVCLSGIITCLLMNHSPEQLRLVMIDPKRVELSAFGEIPHLAFSEIVVEMDRVVGTLQAVINEMETRYRRFAKIGVRNIVRYNEKQAAAGQSTIPYWVVVIDELADLMMAAPFQVESQLVRLAQLARATGIHLVVATQRPSVDVITGLIKANFPTRIAFAVSSMVDSRTILDQGGAEKLLGKGDMLYVPPDAQKPKRVQGVYVADQEIESVVHFWTADRFRELAPEKFDTMLEEAQRAVEESENGADEDDPMLTKAIELAKDHQSLSTSMLQRKLRIGYPRAARLMDDLEERGIVGAGSGSSRPVTLHDDPTSLAAAAIAIDLDRPQSPSASLPQPPTPLAAIREERERREAAARRDPPAPFDAE